MLRDGFKKPWGLGFAQKVNKGEEGFKTPMYIIGSHRFISTNLKGSKYTISLFFMPNSEEIWHIGAVLQGLDDQSPIFIEVKHVDINKAFEELFSQIKNSSYNHSEFDPIRMLWLTHSIYRAPKITLKDVLALEPYNKKRSA